MCAYLAFLYSKVFCPIEKRIVSLNKINLNNLDEMDSFDYIALKTAWNFDPTMEFLGKVHDEELAQKMASGIINPRTLKPYDEVALKSLKKIASS